MTEQRIERAVPVVILLVVFALAGWAVLGRGPDAQAAANGNETKQLAEVAVTQYVMMSHHGAAWDRCAQAGAVVSAYFQAKDDTNYQVWKKTRAADCTLAGVRDAVPR